MRIFPLAFSSTVAATSTGLQKGIEKLTKYRNDWSLKLYPTRSGDTVDLHS
jgi:hypothetical protein